MKEKISHILEGLQHSDWRIRNQAYLNLMDTTSEEALPLFWEMMDKTDDLMDMLLAKKRVPDRKTWLESKGHLTEGSA